MKTAVFLDFDGVTHPSEAILGLNQSITQHAIDSRGLFRWVKHLEELIEAAPQSLKDELFIAAHSSWRMLQNLDQSLVRNGLGKLAPYYVGMTDPSMDRWNSIQDMRDRGQFDNIIILDDSYKEFPEKLEQLIICNPMKGLSDPDVIKKISQLMNAPEKSEHRQREFK